MPTTETNKMLAAAAAACEDKKAEDIRILALDPSESGLTDYFLLCNGTNERQNVAIADEIELRLKREFGTYPNSVEGRRQAEWILLDYVDFIVHVFSAEKRAFYGLERLRKSATTLSLDELNTEIKQQITNARQKKSSANSAPAAPAKSAAKKSPAKAAARKSAAKTPPAKSKAAGASTARKPAKSSTATAAARKPAAKKSTATRSAASKSATKKSSTRKPAR